MISNLMNFVGGSLSFVLPPLFVDDNPSNFVATWRIKDTDTEAPGLGSKRSIYRKQDIPKA